MRDVQRRIDEAVGSGGRELDLSGCRLTDVPESVRGLTSLSSLRLTRNKLVTLPEWLGELTGLMSLDVSDNKLTELPPGIGELRNLLFLDLRTNKLTGLPETLAGLRELNWLNLGGNKFATVPDVLGEFPELVRLILCGNKLTAVPEALAALRKLVRLDLGDNRIAELSPVIGELGELRFLYLHGNRLTSLPESIGNLEELVELKLQGNLLTELPRSMGRLRALTSLDLSGNRIADPPAVLDDLPGLTKLYLVGNPLPDAEERSRDGLPYQMPADARTVTYSSMFTRFLQAMNHPTYEGSGRDTVEVPVHVHRLRELRGRERAAAEDILIAKLLENDPRAAETLAEVECVRAVPALVQATSQQATPRIRVIAARALLRLNDTSGRQALVDILRAHDGDHEVRRDAVELLARFPGPDTDFLLEVACTDPAGGVRSSAFDAVLTIHGLADERIRYGEVLFGIAGRLLSTLRTVRHEAHTELRTILTRWQAGATAEDLGLTWHVSERDEHVGRLVDSFEDDQPEWPVEGLRDRTGRERTLVENLVLLRLAEDQRAVRAARTLGVRRAAEPLRELLDTATGAARAEIESIIETLDADG
jgi:hypothetical protein